MSAPVKHIRVMLIEDHVIMRMGLRLLIESDPTMKVVGETSDYAAALSLAELERPDVILLDLTLPGISGIELLPQLLTVAKQARVLILTGDDDPAVHLSAIRLGAMGLVLKDKSPEVLVKAIKKVHGGEVWFDRSLIANVLGERSRGGETKRIDPAEAKLASLTERELEVVALMGEGLRNKQLADRLFISEGTVRRHLSSIFTKLDISDRHELMVYAYRNGLAKLPD